MTKATKNWHVYILECDDNRLYTGITSDIDRRLKEHLSGRGCKFTKSFGAKRMVYKEPVGSREEALVREAQIKKWPKQKKLELIEK